MGERSKKKKKIFCCPFETMQQNYLKLPDACQTNAKRINKTGITGKTSTIGENGA
jgi:hypothetical protein